MKPLIQTNLHDPENGVAGNCMAAAIASILECDIDSVPDLAQAVLDETVPETHWYFVLAGQLLVFHSIAIETVLPTDAHLIPDHEYVVASGRSPRGDFGHSVVWKAGEMIHDPHPSGDGIVGEPYDYWILRPVKSLGQ